MTHRYNSIIPNLFTFMLWSQSPMYHLFCKKKTITIFLGQFVAPMELNGINLMQINQFIPVDFMQTIHTYSVYHSSSERYCPIWASNWTIYCPVGDFTIPVIMKHNLYIIIHFITNIVYTRIIYDKLYAVYIRRY